MPETDTWLALLILICEMALLVFLYCIGRFYEYKFKDRTFYRWHLLPVIIFAVALIAFFVAGAPLELILLLTNASVLAVTLTFSVFLYMRMTGVSK
jgi:fatty acid desaturase